METQGVDLRSGTQQRWSKALDVFHSSPGSWSTRGPFLSAIYGFLAVEERDEVRPLPVEHSLTQRHHTDCAARPLPFRSALRVDAEAGDGTVEIGAWWPNHDEGRHLWKDLAPWLAVRMTPEDSPWAFRADGESHRVISGLEAFALLMGLKFLLPPHMNGDAEKHLVVAQPGKRPRAFKADSCRFPGMAEELKARAMTAKVQWAPRETNEADALSNLQFAGFSAECRVAVPIPDIRWHIFDQALQRSAEFETQARSNRERPRTMEEVLEEEETQEAPEDRLRLRDPW